MTVGFKQTKTPGRWKDRELTVHRMVDMDTSYIVNCMRICHERGRIGKFAEFQEELCSRGEEIPSIFVMEEHNGI